MCLCETDIGLNQTCICMETPFAAGSYNRCLFKYYIDGYIATKPKYKSHLRANVTGYAYFLHAAVMGYGARCRWAIPLASNFGGIIYSIHANAYAVCIYSKHSLYDSSITCKSI